jgi:hypothetical protein
MRETSGDDGAMLLSLRLRSASALLLLGGCRPFMLTWISEKEPDDCLMRGRRLLGFEDALFGDCVAAGLLPASLRVGVGAAGVAWGTHSSDRSSSHGCVVLAMVVVVSCRGGAEASQETNKSSRGCCGADTRRRSCYEGAHGMLRALATSMARGVASNASPASAMSRYQYARMCASHGQGRGTLAPAHDIFPPVSTATPQRPARHAGDVNAAED